MPASETWRRARQLLLASAFSLVAGYTDVITVIRWKGFATMMTGNLLYLGRAFLQDDPQIPFDQGFYLLIIVTFTLGVVAYRIAEMRLPARGASTMGIVFAALYLSVEVAWLVEPSWAAAIGSYLLAGLTPMFGMLMAACTSGKLGAPTTMITGHIVTAANLATKAALSGEGLTRGERHKAAMSATVLVCTFLGASTGAVVCSMSSERAEGLLLPVPPLLAILLWFYDHEAKPRSLVKHMQRRVRDRRNRRQHDEEDPEGGSSEEGTSSSDDGADRDAARPPACKRTVASTPQGEGGTSGESPECLATSDEECGCAQASAAGAHACGETCV
mmetsp:Transcript_128796/g.360391  ORF Transcript_128796/g.360391 Transcript_128796/m.360391 type:complete len:331 (-) Transcript_128796:162-1154(-)